jgi:hypothetical protein
MPTLRHMVSGNEGGGKYIFAPNVRHSGNPYKKLRRQRLLSSETIGGPALYLMPYFLF